jgi:hypothetical protein
MRTLTLIVALACVFGCYAWVRMNTGSKASAATTSQPSIAGTAAVDSPQKPANESAKGFAKVDFQTQIRPILEARCQPCHFSGGKVYKEMPFDRAETIKFLGTKLFTRIKDENERRLISAFLAQP